MEKYLFTLADQVPIDVALISSPSIVWTACYFLGFLSTSTKWSSSLIQSDSSPHSRLTVLIPLNLASVLHLFLFSSILPFFCLMSISVYSSFLICLDSILKIRPKGFWLHHWLRTF
ncbi:hypothetical protein CDAR_56201 [Caerostris darwini]|uniref:Uncharacterized protein n=1 Tax=Caerostris darwini TaxID=1538125 RepID=A0AAV4RN93_9ARAC|nr:hypothetical protein CDAR_56201 [Caerostris darwini]